MLFSLKSIPQLLFGISLEETDFAKRGFFAGDKDTRQQLELNARTFIQGYMMALADARFTTLLPRLQEIEIAQRGFAFEGAAMGLAVLDYFSPWQQRLITFLEGPAQAHNYMLHVGAGWTVGILPRSYKRLLKQLDPLLGWLAIDGYGFQQGFFAWQRSIEQQKQPSRLSGYARRAFDQGLGRSLWFVKCADAAQITATIGTFPAERQGDLWSGIGLACAYAGGAPHSCIEALATNSGAYYPHLAQGVAFAIKARHKAGNIVQHTELACQSILQAQIDEVVALVDDALAHLPPNDQSYEIWRSRIQDRFATRSRQHYQEHPSFTGPF